MGRLIIANAVMLLLMQTVLTSPAVVHALAFAPAGGRGLQQPWTVLTYMFVHADLLHLAANMLGLYVFGTAVEQRLGSRSFIWFYLYCGIGAALFTLLLSPIREISPFIGASGAVMGVTVAYALLWPDAEILVFPFPMPVSARTLAIGLVVFNVAMAFVFHGGMIAYEAHVGGALMGYLFFRAQAIARRAPREPMRPIERVVMAPTASAVPPAGNGGGAPARSPRRRADNDPVAAEIDRVLDKISAEGMQSLTPQEREFLDEVAKRKKERNDLH